MYILIVKLSISIFLAFATDRQKDDFLEEIRLMKEVGQHKHIISLIGCVTISEPLCLIVEHMEHGDLLNFLRSRRSQVGCEFKLL